MPFADLPTHMSIASNAGAYAIPMAEHNLAMTLALAKRLLIEHQKLRNGEFDDTTLNRSLYGATAGLIGFGGTGRATARLMRAFGMHIYALNQSGKSTEPTEFETLARNRTGFQPISAAFLIACAANFGEASLKKTSAPRVFSVTI